MTIEIFTLEHLAITFHSFLIKNKKIVTLSPLNSYDRWQNQLNNYQKYTREEYRRINCYLMQSPSQEWTLNLLPNPPFRLVSNKNADVTGAVSGQCPVTIKLKAASVVEIERT